MERHHEMQLKQMLDELYLEGVASARWDMIYLWFDAQRLGKASYRQLLHHWEEYCSSYGHKTVPTLEVFHYPNKPTLTLLRGTFDKTERREPLANWT